MLPLVFEAAPKSPAPSPGALTLVWNAVWWRLLLALAQVFPTTLARGCGIGGPWLSLDTCPRIFLWCVVHTDNSALCAHFCYFVLVQGPASRRQKWGLVLNGVGIYSAVWCSDT